MGGWIYSVETFIFYSFGNRCRRDRNGLQAVQNAPPHLKNYHFRVILTQHCMSVVGSPCSFRGFLEPYYGQTRPKRDPVSNKTAFKGVFCSTSNAGERYFDSDANTHLPVLLRYHLVNFYPRYISSLWGVAYLGCDAFANTRMWFHQLRGSLIYHPGAPHGGITCRLWGHGCSLP